MKRVYVAETLVDGQMIVDLLHEAGIPAHLFQQNGMGALGELPVTSPEVWVRRDSDLESAVCLVENFDAKINPENILSCESCGEKNPGSFEICWQCNQPLQQNDEDPSSGTDSTLHA